MTNNPQLPPHLVFYALYTTFEALQSTAPSEARAEALRRLAPLRHRIAHGGHPDQLDGLDDAMRELLDEIDASSLGHPEVRALRSLVSPTRVAKTIARRDDLVGATAEHAAAAAGRVDGGAPEPTSPEDSASSTRTEAEQFGAELRRLRLSKGMSLASLGQAVYMSKGYLSKVENGRARPTPALVSRLSTVLDIPADLLAAAGFSGVPRPTVQNSHPPT